MLDYIEVVGSLYEGSKYLKIFNKIAIQGTPHMAVDKEAMSLSRVYSYNNNNNITSKALKSSGARARKRNKTK